MFVVKQSKFVVLNNKNEVLTMKNFKKSDMLENSQIRLFNSVCDCCSFMKAKYNLGIFENYKIMKAKIIIECEEIERGEIL